MRPRWNESGHAVEPGCVGIRIGRNVRALRARLINFFYDLGHASPVMLARNFDVPDLNWNVSFAADAKGLVDGSEDVVALAAHVSRVDPSEFRRFAGKRDEFFGLRIGSRCVFER